MTIASDWLVQLATGQTVGLFSKQVSYFDSTVVHYASSSSERDATLSCLSVCVYILTELHVEEL